MDIVRTLSASPAPATSLVRRKAVAKAVTATVMLAFTVLGFHETALAETDRQRFHITYAGPFSFADPPERRLTAVGPIRGRGYEQFISEGPGPEPGTSVSTTELVFPDGSVFLTVTATGETRFNARACIAFNTATGTWEITGGTGAYTGATGQGTYEGRNILSARRTADGCPAEPDRLISNLKLDGAVTVPGDQAA